MRIGANTMPRKKKHADTQTLVDYLRCDDPVKLARVIDSRIVTSGGGGAVLYMGTWPPRSDTDDETTSRVDAAISGDPLPEAAARTGFVHTRGWPSGRISYVIKLQKHLNKDPNRDGAHVDAMVLEWIRDNIIAPGYSPAFVEILYVHECTLPDIDCTPRTGMTRPESSIRAQFCRWYDQVSRHDTPPRVTVSALERCQFTFESFVGWLFDDAFSETIFKSMLFMVIHGLYVLELLLPQTRHRDLHLQNIMVKFVPGYVPTDTIMYNKFTVGASTWIVPFIGWFPKIIDFGGAISPELQLHSDQDTHPENLSAVITNDLEFFMHRMYDHLSMNSLTRLMGLINALNPQMHHRRLFKNTFESADYPTYASMLNGPVFSDYAARKEDSVHIYREYTYDAAKPRGGTDRSHNSDTVRADSRMAHGGDSSANPAETNGRQD